MNKNYISVANRVLEHGFESVLKKSRYSRSELLGILEIVRYYKTTSKHNQTKLQRLIRNNCFSYFLEADKIGVLSDTHIQTASGKTNWDYIYWCYDFFASKGIKDVFHLGDMFDGYYMYKYLNDNNYFQNICHEQLEEFHKNYPEGFNTYVVFGNHDAQFYKVSIDLYKILSNLRLDVIPLGYEVAYIDWCDQSVLLKHPAKCKDLLHPPVLNADIKLFGHSHFYTYDVVNSRIKVPTCSNNHPNGTRFGNSRAGFLILEKNDESFSLERYVFEESGYQKILKL